MRLPLDIFDVIFELIADDPYRLDVETLKSCTLTSSSISAICEKHLYSCLYLYAKDLQSNEEQQYRQPDPYYPQCRMRVDNYIRTLAKKPNITHHVRRLGFIILDPRITLNPAERSWWESIGHITNKVQHDKIQWFKFYSDPQWPLRINPETLSSIVRTLKSPALEELHLYGTNDKIPFQHIFTQKASSLKRLNIAHANVPSDFHPPLASDSFRVPTALDSFTQGSHSLSTPGALFKICNPQGNPCIDLSSLSSLSLCLSALQFFKIADVAYICKLLNKTTNLRSLALHTSDSYMDVANPEKTLKDAIEKCSETLETLTLIWNANSSALFDSITEFLQFSRAFRCLAQVQLQVFLPHNIDSGCPWKEIEWGQLATILSDMKIYPMLRKVGISMAPTRSAILSEGVSKYILAGGKVVTKQLETRGTSTRLDFAVDYL